LRRRNDAFDVRSVTAKYKSAFKKFKQTILRPKENPLWFDIRSRRYRILAVNLAIAGTSAGRLKKAGTQQKKYDLQAHLSMILMIPSPRLFKSDEICHVCIQLANFRDIGLTIAFGDSLL
jgi:hypothetical protein